MKQQNRKVIFYHNNDFHIGSLLQFVGVGENTNAVIEVTGGKIMSVPIEYVSFDLNGNKSQKELPADTKVDKVSKISSSQILEIVSQITGLSVYEIKSSTKKRLFVYARYIYIVLCKKYRQGDSLVYIASHIGFLHHSNIIKANSEHETKMTYDDYAEIFNKCEAEIKAII